MERGPVVIPVKLPQGLVAHFGGVADRAGCFLLDSGDVPTKGSRYSFAGINPIHTFSANDGFVTIDGHTVIDNPLSALKKFVASTTGVANSDPYLPFVGGLVGFVGFEWGNARGNIVTSSHVPDVFFGFYDTIVTYDHLERAAWVSSLGLTKGGTQDLSLAKLRAEKFSEELSQSYKKKSFMSFPPLEGSHSVTSSLTKKDFINGVKVLSGTPHLPLFAQQFASPTHKTPWRIYTDLRGENQTSYAAYLNCGDFTVLSQSRTCLMKVNADNIKMSPTKGSTAKLAVKDQDGRALDRLRYDDEIQSSHRYMVADVMKNLNDVCDPKSIEASSVAHIESDAKAHHLVSSVVGVRTREADILDCLLAVLPSFSDGRLAPVISKIEGAARNVYTGTIGFISCNGLAEFNSAFRTMVLKDTIGYLHAGTEVGRETNPEEAYARVGKTAGHIFELVH